MLETGGNEGFNERITRLLGSRLGTKKIDSEVIREDSFKRDKKKPSEGR